MTLCAMLKDINQKPRTFEEIKKGQFYMVNKKHIVEASKRMQTMPRIKSKMEKFSKWECFVVWNKDDHIICKIFAYYNQVNHFYNFMPTWATNIIGARFVWEKMGSPRLDKEATELGKTVANPRRTLREANNHKKFKVSDDFQLESS